MSRSDITRFCADPADVALMRRDGLGWGHDLECGILPRSQVHRPARRSLIARLVRGRTS